MRGRELKECELLSIPMLCIIYGSGVAQHGMCSVAVGRGQGLAVLGVATKNHTGSLCS